MKKDRVDEIDVLTQTEGFWDDQQTATKLTKERESLSQEIGTVEVLNGKISDNLELLSLVSSDTDVADIEKEIPGITEGLEDLTYYALFDGPYDDRDVIVTVRAGAGGDDAQDWSEMLVRMYVRFAERHDFSVEIFDRTAGAEAGIKSMTFQISGQRAYGLLRAESGVHRLVRLSPFNADNLRQTSFAQVETLPVITTLPAVEVKMEDLKIDTFRSSGAGGQSVNTTDSAVRVTHVPSGIVASCQNERSQLQNKLQAIKVVTAKLHKKHLEAEDAKQLALRGEQKQAEWGSQIRSYVLHPYKMVKDHRTKHESHAVDNVLDGDLDRFIEAYLHMS